MNAPSALASPPTTSRAPSSTATPTRCGDLVALGERDEGAERVRAVEPWPGRDGAQPRGHPLHERVVDAGVDVEAVRGRAGRPAVAHLRRERALHGAVEVRAGQHDERGVAAELHGGADDGVGRRVEEFAADLGRSGERELAHRGVREHARDERPGRHRRDEVHDPRGRTRPAQHVDDVGGGERGLAGGLEDRRAAGGERRPELAGGHRRREVPRRDQQRDPDRLPRDDDALVPRRREAEVTRHSHGLLGEPAEELGGVGCLGQRVGPRLAVLPHHELGELLLLGAQDLERARTAARCARRGLVAAQAGNAASAAATASSQSCSVATANSRDDAAVGGVDHRESATVAAGSPRAADEQVGDRGGGESRLGHGFPPVQPSGGPGGRGRRRSRPRRSG